MMTLEDYVRIHFSSGQKVILGQILDGCDRDMTGTTRARLKDFRMKVSQDIRLHMGEVIDGSLSFAGVDVDLAHEDIDWEIYMSLKKARNPYKGILGVFGYIGDLFLLRTGIFENGYNAGFGTTARFRSLADYRKYLLILLVASVMAWEKPE